jgi:hypothetical protein
VTVQLTAPVEGKNVGDNYTGANEAYHLASGNASQAGYNAKVGAVLTGSANAVNIVTGGNLVLEVGSQSFTVALADADTPAAAATKIDTALAGVADATIAASKLAVTSVATGSTAQVRVVSGTGTVLANLGLAVDQAAYGSDGGVGVANTGPADVPIANNREFDATRDARVEPDPAKPLASTPAEATNSDVVAKPTYDDVISNAPAEWPTSVSKIYTIVNGKVAGARGPAAGGTVVHIRGFGLSDVTGVAFGGVAGTAFTVVNDREITVTTGAHAAGVVDVVLTDPDGNETVVGGYTYTA